MKLLKQIFLIFIGSLIINANYAQCPVDETEITIQFIEDGHYPGEILWDYKIGDLISNAGPYNIRDIITTCVPEGDLTIVGCDTASDTWNDAIFQISITEDGSVNSCSSQNSCLLYKSTLSDSNSVVGCTEEFKAENEIVTINLKACGENEVLTSGCTNAVAINYSSCALIDDDSCKIPSANNDCSNATFISISESGYCESESHSLSDFNNNSSTVQPDCSETIAPDAFYKFKVPTNGRVKILTYPEVGVALYNSCGEAPNYCVNNALSYDIYQKVFENLPTDDTLILQIFSVVDQFSFCIEEAIPIPNNDCANATPINLYTDAVDEDDWITHSNEYNGIDINPSCEDDIYADAFYSFVVPASGQVRFQSNNQYLGLSIYNSCSDEAIICKNSTTNLIVDNLTPADTLILQIFDDELIETIQFRLYNSIPSSNNKCQDAIFLSVSPTANCTANLNSLVINNNSSDGQNECSANAVRDAFYTFVVPDNGKVVVSATGYMGISIFSSCGEASLFCDSDYYFEIEDLPPLDTVILQIIDPFNFDFSINDIFYFCITEASATLNNNCAAAQKITVSPPGECSTYTNELTLNFNTPSITESCDVDVFADAFYEIEVPNSGSIRYYSTDSYLGFALYKACNDSMLVCKNYGSDHIINNLVPGENLIVQIFSPDKPDRFYFCIEEVAPLQNNLCEKAKLLTVAENGNCEMNEVSLRNLNYNSANLQPNCRNEISYDAFYKFAAPLSGYLLFSSDEYTGFSIYSACNDSTLYCNEYTYNEIISNLPIEDTLILQIFDSHNVNTLNFCLEDAKPSINNSCENAIPIEVAESGNCSSNTIDFTNFNYNTANIKPSCAYEINYDAFYKFKVPESGIISLSSDDIIGYSIYSSCNNNELFCQNYSYGHDGIIRNLPSGDILILQIFDDYGNSTFSFCLEEIIPSTNNNCTNALPIIVAETGNCEMHQVELTNLKNNSSNFTESCNSQLQSDAFYKFAVPQSGQIIFSTEDYISASIYNACTGNTLLCKSYNSKEVIRNLPAGDTLILQIFENRTHEKISFCLEAVEASVNNNCVNASPLTVAESGMCQNNWVTLTNFNFNTGNQATVCDYGIAYDVFYEFVVPESGQVLFSSTENIGLAIYEACNGNSLYCNYYTSSEIIRNLQAGETLILQIFEDSTQDDFSFCLEESIPNLNNLCINAEPFIVNEPGNCEGNYIQVANTTNNTDINPYCASYVIADAFYSFIVPASGHIAVSSSKYVGISIYDDCLEQSFYCNENFQDEVIYGLIAGDTLLLQVFQINETYDLELCLEEAPPSSNNNCETATNLQVYEEGACEGNFISASINNNSVSIIPTCKYISADIFYKIKVPESGQIKIEIDSYGVGLSIFTSCDTIAIFCDNDVREQVIKKLPANEELLLQLFQYGNPNDFQFCIEDALPTINNNCANAISIDVAPANAIFENNYTLNLQNNNVDKSPECEAISRDAFYNFITPENGKVLINVNYGFGIALYKDCGSESIFCQPYIDDFVIISDLPPGEELILQIFGRDNTEIEFSVFEAIDNIDCKNASTLCEPSLTGTNAGAVQEISYNELNCDLDNNRLNSVVWYSFTTNNTGSSVSFELTKTECSYNFNDLNAVILSNSCENDRLVEDCITLPYTGDKDTLSIQNPTPNKLYYLIIGSEYYYDYCNYEINVLEGIDFDCCQLEYSLNTWCYYQNPNNYFVDVTINDMGQNPSGYRLTETGQQITSEGTTRIGPIPNGIQTITLEGLDQQDCISTESINFNCSACAEHLIHTNAQMNKGYKFNASKTIESAIKVMPSTTIQYFAGDSIILKKGFTVEKGAAFSIDIEDCE